LSLKGTAASIWSCRLPQDERRAEAQPFQVAEGGTKEPDGPPTVARLYSDPGERQEQPAAIALRGSGQKIADAYQNGSGTAISAATQRMGGQVKDKASSGAVHRADACLAARSSGKPSPSWCARAWRSRDGIRSQRD